MKIVLAQNVLVDGKVRKAGETVEIPDSMKAEFERNGYVEKTKAEPKPKAEAKPKAKK